MKLFLTPHADDETLFGAFTLIREQPTVLVCFSSVRDYGDDETRLGETRKAVEILGAGPAQHLQPYDHPSMEHRLKRWCQESDYGSKGVTHVWVPHEEASHPEHRLIGPAAREVFDCPVSTYHTYNASGKVRLGLPVRYEAEWLALKLRALACYESQIRHPRACQFFAWDLLEYDGGDL